MALKYSIRCDFCGVRDEVDILNEVIGAHHAGCKGTWQLAATVTPSLTIRAQDASGAMPGRVMTVASGEYVDSKWCDPCGKWVPEAHVHQGKPEEAARLPTHCYYCPSTTFGYRDGVPTCGACFERHRRQE